MPFPNALRRRSGLPSMKSFGKAAIRTPPAYRAIKNPMTPETAEREAKPVPRAKIRPTKSRAEVRSSARSASQNRTEVTYLSGISLVLTTSILSYTARERIQRSFSSLRFWERASIFRFMEAALLLVKGERMMERRSMPFSIVSSV